MFFVLKIFWKYNFRGEIVLKIFKKCRCRGVSVLEIFKKPWRREWGTRLGLPKGESMPVPPTMKTKDT